MPKFLVRVVAFLLVPCLIADPVFAAVLHDPLSFGEAARRILFTQQALAARLDTQSGGSLVPKEIKTEEFQGVKREISGDLAAPAADAISIQALEEVLSIVGFEGFKGVSYIGDPQTRYSHWVTNKTFLRDRVLPKAKNEAQIGVIMKLLKGEINAYWAYGDLVSYKQTREGLMIIGHSDAGKSYLSSRFFSSDSGFASPDESPWFYGGHDDLLILSYKGIQYVASDLALPLEKDARVALRWHGGYLDSEKPIRVKMAAQPTVTRLRRIILLDNRKTYHQPLIACQSATCAKEWGKLKLVKQVQFSPNERRKKFLALVQEETKEFRSVASALTKMPSDYRSDLDLLTNFIASLMERGIQFGLVKPQFFYRMIVRALNAHPAIRLQGSKVGVVVFSVLTEFIHQKDFLSILNWQGQQIGYGIFEWSPQDDDTEARFRFRIYPEYRNGYYGRDFLNVFTQSLANGEFIKGHPVDRLVWIPGPNDQVDNFLRSFERYGFRWDEENRLVLSIHERRIRGAA